MKFLKRCIASEAVVRRCSSKFSKIHRKHLCQSLFLNNVAGLSPATLLKKRLWYRCFPVNFVKFVRTPFLQNISGWLLLYMFMITNKFFKFSMIVRDRHQTLLLILFVLNLINIRVEIWLRSLIKVNNSCTGWLCNPAGKDLF